MSQRVLKHTPGMLLLTPKGHLVGHTGDMTVSVPVEITVKEIITGTVKSVNKYLNKIEYGEIKKGRE